MVMPEGGKITMHLGRPFHEKSDIDFFIVNKPLYGYVERRGRELHIDTRTLDPKKLKSLGLKELAGELARFRGHSKHFKTTLKIFADENDLAQKGSYIVRKR
jgi:hypothetical protein